MEPTHSDGRTALQRRPRHGVRSAQGIAVNQTHAYWVASDQIMRVALDGTQMASLAWTDQFSLGTIALDDQYVYWSTTDRTTTAAP